MSADAQPRRKRWFRYSLRALLVFITLFMMWGGYHTNRSWKERAAEKVLLERGASCQYGAHPIQGDLTRRVAAIYARVVQTVWRERFITRVRSIGPMDEETVDALACLPHLKSLSISPSLPTTEERQRIMRGQVLHSTATLDPGALAKVLRSCDLQELQIAAWALSDEDCRAIVMESGLEGLAVDGCSLSEDNFAGLITKPGLVRFSFRYCEVTGSALANRPGSTSLEFIQCDAAPIGHEFAQFIGSSPQISSLAASHNSADDDFVRHLGAHPALESISLFDSQVTDDCITIIGQMPRLKVVGLPRSVSPAAAARLQQSKPGLHVSRN